MSNSDNRIWAPWRVDYILGTRPPSCPFCNIKAGCASPESLVLAVQEHAHVILNRYPYSGCHILVCPHRHVAKLDDLTDLEYGQLMSLLRSSVAAVQSACSPEGINVGINLGSAAGAGIEEHLHFHVVPRWSGDTNFMTAVGDTRVMSQDLAHAWQMLRPEFESLDISLESSK